MGCPFDGAVEVQFFWRARASEFPQPTQCQLDIARPQLDLVFEISEFSLVPCLDRAEIAVGVLTDANALRIVAIGPVRRGPGSPDPFRSALVAVLLLGQALAERFEQLVESAHRLDLL